MSITTLGFLLGIKFRSSCLCGKHFITELFPRPLIKVNYLMLLILRSDLIIYSWLAWNLLCTPEICLPLPFRCWNSKCVTITPGPVFGFDTSSCLLCSLSWRQIHNLSASTSQVHGNLCNHVQLEACFLLFWCSAWNPGVILKQQAAFWSRDSSNLVILGVVTHLSIS